MAIDMARHAATQPAVRAKCLSTSECQMGLICPPHQMFVAAECRGCRGQAFSSVLSHVRGHLEMPALLRILEMMRGLQLPVYHLFKASATSGSAKSSTFS